MIASVSAMTFGLEITLADMQTKSQQVLKLQHAQKLKLSLNLLYNQTDLLSNINFRSIKAKN